VTDWATTISALATGVGTLVLAVATFGAVRSANRAARIAEASRAAGMRPVLMHSRLQDAGQKIVFGDRRWLGVLGGGATVVVTDEAIYMVVSLRNAGTGMGILHGWRLRVGRHYEREAPPLAEFTPQTRDMYVAPGDIGFWQGALRDPRVPEFAEIMKAVADREMLSLDILYGDFEGGQRVISRFTLEPPSADPRLAERQAAWLLDAEPPGAGAPGAGLAARGPARGVPEGAMIASVARHWNVDRPDPRQGLQG
jgi:hypothetical protein